MVQACLQQSSQYVQFWEWSTPLHRDQYVYIQKQCSEQYVIYRYMQKSQNQESSIAEEEHFNIPHVNRQEEQSSAQQIKYASVNEIRSFERSSQIYNQKLIEKCPLLFSEQSLSSVLPIRFVNSATEQLFTLGGRVEENENVLQVGQDKIVLRLAVSNIRCQNSLVVGIKNLKKRAILELMAVQVSNEQTTAKFKYSMQLNDTNLLLRVFVGFDGQYKIWKEIEVPLTENKFTVQINEYNNEQTDIKINDFLFHLLLKMPYHQKINYCLLHHGKAEVQKLEFVSRPQKKQVQVKQSQCTKECQLI